MTGRIESSRFTGIAGGFTIATCVLLTACTPTDRAVERIVGASSASTSARAPIDLPAIAFTQLDFNLDDGRHNNSAWGNARLTYLGAEPVLYLNLVVDGRW